MCDFCRVLCADDVRPFHESMVCAGCRKRLQLRAHRYAQDVVGIVQTSIEYTFDEKLLKPEQPIPGEC